MARFMILVLMWTLVGVHYALVMLTPSEILSLTEENCVIVSTNDLKNIELLNHLDENVFNETDNIFMGIINIDGFLWPDKTQPKFVQKISNIYIFQKVLKIRDCLMKVPKLKPNIVAFQEDVTLKNLVNFVNNNCYAYKSINGGSSVEGLHRKEILQSLFYVQNISNKNVGHLFENHDSKTCSVDGCPMTPTSHNIYKSSNIPQCDRIPVSVTKDFFHDYLKISKPVIIEGAMKYWNSAKWSEKYLRNKYGHIDVHIKMTSTGEYEGVEPVELWENYKSFTDNIPAEVKEQLPFPDLVVVRPATLNMKFSEFLDLIKSISNNTMKNVSAYLEYSSIREYFPEVEEDIHEMEFIKDMLNLKHLNIWLSDGNTLGKTHFDPFDNFLCQLSGKKEVILFDPHNNRNLYEGHIPEAMLSYDKKKKKFTRRHLSDSTSLVMSPVDILKPDLQRFPLFSEAYPINCTISEGDVLFMPAFWWHEVQSYPSFTEGRNLAVNFWYEPFLTKEFPCESCKLDINAGYRHLL